MRKAIHLLRAMGVVETKSGCGTFVTTSPPTLELEALTLLAPFRVLARENRGLLGAY